METVHCIMNILPAPGITGDWTSYFTPELEEKFEQWVEKWKDVASEIPFKYKINKKA